MTLYQDPMELGFSLVDTYVEISPTDKSSLLETALILNAETIPSALYYYYYYYCMRSQGGFTSKHK